MSMMPDSRKPFLAALGFVSILLGGCASLSPEPLNNEEITQVAQQDRTEMQAAIEPLAGPLSLEEAIARALKYNADRHLKALDEAVADGTLQAGKFDMLPKLVAGAGYRDRDSDLITRSKDSVTGTPSLAHPSISSSRSAVTTELGFSWSLLDFGQSYYAAKQNADRVLVAQERRRRALHNLVQDVRTAYWRVVAAQALRGQIASVITDAEEVLDLARKAEEKALRNPLDPLRYQLQLLENLKLLEQIEQELSTARIDLASLINLPLVQDIQVVEPPLTINRHLLDTPVEAQEEGALQRNAEFRESLYNARIAQQESRRLLLKLFPGLSFNYGTKHSSDSYLINNTWKETGVQLSFNLLGLLAAPAQLRLADAGVALADQKRVVTQLAVLTQLHIARLNYANALKQYARTENIVRVESRMAKHIANQEKAEKQARLDSVARQTALILAQLRRYHALSNAQSAASRLQATLGMDLAIDNEQEISLPDLTQRVAQALQAWSVAEAGK